MPGIRAVVNKSIIIFYDVLENIIIQHKRKTEIRKFQDPRRKAIYEKIELSDDTKRKIDDFYLKNYGEKIPYVWHRHYAAFTGKQDIKYFPELLFIPEFERFMNIYPEYEAVFSDKNVLPYIAATAGINMPKILLSSTKKLFRNSNNDLLSKATAIKWLDNAGEVFAKPSVDSCSGEGCLLLDMKNGRDKKTGFSSQEILDTFHGDCVIQERVKCSDEIAALHPNSCNTFRVITYRWKGEIEFFPIIMRIGRHNNCVDNAHAGGIFIGVSDDGVLNKYAFTEFGEKYEQHPDTGIIFENYKIHGIDKVKRAAKKLHTLVPQVGVVNWDFTINSNNEPVLIEANIGGGSIWLVEIAHGCGAFGDKTEEILQWMKKMKKIKKSERKKYSYGD